ncbi:hypothetical protein CYJ52_25660, partial [Escherichia coli]
FSGPKTSIICSPMTSLKTSIKTITYLSDIGCLEIQGASLLWAKGQWLKITDGTVQYAPAARLPLHFSASGSCAPF